MENLKQQKLFKCYTVLYYNKSYYNHEHIRTNKALKYFLLVYMHHCIWTFTAENNEWVSTSTSQTL